MDQSFQLGLLFKFMQVTVKKRRQVHDQNVLNATLLKAVFPLPEEFQRGLFAEIYYEYS